MSIIALDIGGTKIASAIFDYNGNMTHYNRNLIKGRTGHEVAKIATKLINKLIVINHDADNASIQNLIIIVEKY